jgi:hypothetical protein
LRAPATPVRPGYTARPGEAIHVFRDDDGSFAIGAGRVKITPDDILFANDVVRDLGRIAHLPEGEAVLRQGDVTGHPVLIAKADPPTEPPNGWILPDDLAAATARGAAAGPASGGGARAGTGAGCGSTIVYDPADWPRRGDPRSPTSAAILLLLLRQANANAAGESNPAAPDWGVPPAVSAGR